jgi:hypothetical protein
MTDTAMESMRTIVALLLRNGVEPPCEWIAKSLQIEDPEIVRKEVARKRSNAAAYPTGAEGK